jgi:predicted dehydrogenase
MVAEPPERVPSLRWGVLGGGRIAAQFVVGVAESKTGTLVAVGSHDLDRARRLASETSTARGYGSYSEVVESGDVDAIYIATPHPQHLELITAGTVAGKHVLCEKPITMTAAQACKARGAASNADVVLVEAMMYRFQPQTAVLRSVLSRGLIGTPRHGEVSCSCVAPYVTQDRLFDRALGGGAILDVGCYSMSFARMVAGWLSENESVEPTLLEGAGHIGESGVEDWAVASLDFDSGLSAHVRAGIRLEDDPHVRIYGTEGHIRILNPWTPGRGGAPAEMILTRVGHDGVEVVVSETKPLFGAETDAVAESVGRGYATEMSVEDSVATMRSLDRWRSAVGVI